MLENVTNIGTLYPSVPSFKIIQMYLYIQSIYKSMYAYICIYKEITHRR